MLNATQQEAFEQEVIVDRLHGPQWPSGLTTIEEPCKAGAAFLQTRAIAGEDGKIKIK